MPRPTRLPQSFYRRDAVSVAKDLVGMLIRREDVELRITEVEAYSWPDDSACHARFGRTKRNDSMWGPPGRAYVYLCYGIHQMLNVVTNRKNEAAAVLIRSCELVRGLASVRQRRGPRAELLNGPGKVGAALGLDPSWSHHRLYRRGALELLDGEAPESLLAGPRIGIGYASPRDQARLWRFGLPASKSLSHPKFFTREIRRGSH